MCGQSPGAEKTEVPEDATFLRIHHTCTHCTPPKEGGWQRAPWGMPATWGAKMPYRGSPRYTSVPLFRQGDT